MAGWILIHTGVTTVCLKDNGKARKDMTKDSGERSLGKFFSRYGMIL